MAKRPAPELSPARQRLAQEVRRVQVLIDAKGSVEPNHQVVLATTMAGRQRQKASVAANRQTRKELLLSAQRYEKSAQEAWHKQLAEHWSKMADAETVALADGRGDILAMEETHIPDWLRDEHGALVPGPDGLPQMRFETAKARRKTHGIDHVMRGGRMREAQYRTAETYGLACAQVAMALLGGREETGIPASAISKPSPGPADWKLEAMATKKVADYRLRIALGEIEGLAVIKLLEAVCYEGLTPRQFAGGGQNEGVRAEERLLVGLNILGVRGDFALPKVQS